MKGGAETLWRELAEPALEPEAVLPHQQGAATELITFLGARAHCNGCSIVPAQLLYFGYLHGYGHCDNLMASWSHGGNMPMIPITKI